VAASEYQKGMLEGQRELRTQLEQINRTLAARMSEMEHRLESRFERVPGYGPASASAATSVPSTMRADHVQATAARHEAAQDAQLREAQERQERAGAEHAVAAQPDRATATDRPAESGWRRWF
jgi:hypothetical protein